MSTITLYKDKINGVGSLLDDIIKSSNNLNAQLGTLKNTLQGVDSSTCNLQDTVDSISSSSKSEKDKVEDLKKLNNKLTDFIEMTTRRDSSAKAEIERAKEDFYTKYKYLKPECEKSRIEKVVDAMKKACEWCKEHWKEILLAIEVIVAVVCLFIPGAQGFGILLLKHIAIGMLKGLVLGAVIGAVAGYAQGGVEGIIGGALKGAKDGAIMGGIFGGLSQMGTLIHCSTLVSNINTVSKVLSIGMGTFDTLALGEMALMRFNQDTGLNIPTTGGLISGLNAKAHSNKYYNAFQFITSAVAVTTSSAQCFVAGTLVLTAVGLVAIETVKTGDMVYAADEDTLEVALKPVLETYVRETDKLVHLTVNNEKIVSTFDHPYYVKGKGFVNAEGLYIGTKLVNSRGEELVVEGIYKEYLKNECVKVYNFKVSETHTYHVGIEGILVHNAHYPSNRDKYMGKTPSKKSKVGQEVIDRMRSEGRIREGLDGLEFKAGDGNWYSIDRADMAHIKDAVSWWNEEGRNYGAKAPEVRAFMKDANNYELELDSINRSQGPHNQTYLPPAE